MITLLYTASIAFPIVCAALGAGIGQSLIGVKALQAANIQPHSITEISRISMIGIALTETSSILGLVISILLILDRSVPIHIEYAAYGRLGIALAIGLTSLIAGIASSYPAQAACLSVARQPFFSNKILQLMLLTQSIIMTPNIFGFIIALLINGRIATLTTFNEALLMIASGISIGLGCIGPCIGLSLFATAACTAIGINRKSYSKLLPFTFMCEGIIETPIIFSLLVALMILLNITVDTSGSNLQGIACLSAALSMSLSTIGTGISAGNIGSTACYQIGKNIDIYPMMSRIGLLALTMIDTFAIYGFIIAIILIYAI